MNRTLVYTAPDTAWPRVTHWFQYATRLFWAIAGSAIAATGEQARSQAASDVNLFAASANPSR